MKSEARYNTTLWQSRLDAFLERRGCREVFERYADPDRVREALATDPKHAILTACRWYRTPYGVRYWSRLDTGWRQEAGKFLKADENP